CQPDLNWRNPSLRAAMLDVLRFWLERGVDGFGISMLNWLGKDNEFRNDPVNPDYNPENNIEYQRLNHIYSKNCHEAIDYLKEISKVIREYPDRIIIGKTDQYTPLEKSQVYFDSGMIDLPTDFGFHLLPWKASILRKFVGVYNDSLPVQLWPNYQLGNHDNQRIASRVGDQQARVAAMLLLTLRGTP
ncbi:MAG: alpha-amylase family glycosyl hydrolase, partial [Candidatus Hodarchaeales archaeon]